MVRYTAAAVALALMLGASAVTSAIVEVPSDERATVAGVSSQDVMPVLGGGIELHACRNVSEHGPYNIVEFGPSGASDQSGVQLIVDEAPAGACAHLVIFTQPGPTAL